ncbi:MAG: M23 family metallopeptidase [Fusobacteria bacterium]|jgi:murein DD-endopeptidase MepM/ murein hydrolase activator NlpD|nr:M23 family metallopeptidase [Fusobacteriota bacterium]
MKKFTLILIFISIIGCSTTNYDDGTTKHQTVTKTNSYDDGTNKYSIKDREYSISPNHSNENIKVNSNDNSTNFITKKESSVIASHDIKRPEPKKVESNQNIDSSKNVPTITETPKISNTPLPVQTTDISKQVAKSSTPEITSKYDIFYPTDEIIILKDYSEKNDNRNSGIDFRVGSLTSIKATAPGMVIFSGKKPSLGNSVFLFHNDGFISIYYNLDMLKVNKGDYIKNHDTEIGIAKDSFHFELRKQTSNGLITIDPKNILKKRRN